MDELEPATPADHPDRAHVFVDDLDQPELTEDDDRHLRRSLRLRDGTVLTVGDGAGSWREARLGTGVEPVGPIVRVSEPTPTVTIGLPAIKGDRTEWAVQKLTEVGVDRIVVLDAQRSVVRWTGARGQRHLDRLRRVAREAAMQSRRVRIPTIVGVVSLSELVAAEHPASVGLAQRGGTSANGTVSTIVVGPEGGWTESELNATSLHVNLSDNVLRVETAALVAAVSLTQLRASQVDDRGEC